MDEPTVGPAPQPLSSCPPAAIAAGPLSLRAAVPAWLDFKRYRHNLSASSVGTYRAHLRRLLKAIGESRDLDDAAPLVEPFLLALGQRGRSESYRAKAFKVFRDFYRWSCDHGHARLNPLSDGRAPIVHDPMRLFLTPGQVGQLLEHVRGASTIHALRDYTLYKTLYDTWARVGAVCRSKPEDYDLGSCTVRLYEKGGKDRVIPFDPDLAPALEAWFKVRPKESPMMFPAQPRNGTRWTVLDRDRVGRVLREIYAPGAGLGPGVTPHTLRRSGADAARRRGVDLRVIQGVLGHKELNTTMVYLGITTPDELRGAWRKAVTV